MWKVFSDFVHFSNVAFEIEMRTDSINLNHISEAFQYSYNSLYLAFKYFERNLGLKFIEDEELTKKHGILYKC